MALRRGASDIKDDEEKHLITLPTEQVDAVEIRNFLEDNAVEDRIRANDADTIDLMEYFYSYYFPTDDGYYTYNPVLKNFKFDTYKTSGMVFGHFGMTKTLKFLINNRKFKVLNDLKEPQLFYVERQSARARRTTKYYYLNDIPIINIPVQPYDNFDDKAKKGVELFWEHIKRVLCSNNEQLFKFNKYWIIRLLNLRKPYVAIYNYSDGGTGKSMVSSAIRNIIGDYSLLDEQGATLLKSRFNGEIENNLFVCIEEAKANNINQWSAQSNKLKSYITEDYVKTEDKNIKAKYIPNYISIWINTNNERTLKFDAKGERRWCFNDIDNNYSYKFRNSELHKNSEETKWIDNIIPYWGTKIDDRYTDLRKRCCRCLYNYCLEEYKRNEEIKYFDFEKNIPTTETAKRFFRFTQTDIQDAVFETLLDANIFKLDVEIDVNELKTLIFDKQFNKFFPSNFSSIYSSEMNNPQFTKLISKDFSRFIVKPLQANGKVAHSAKQFIATYKELENYFLELDIQGCDENKQDIDYLNSRDEYEIYKKIKQVPNLIAWYEQHFIKTEPPPKGKKRNVLKYVFKKKWKKLDDKYKERFEKEKENGSESESENESESESEETTEIKEKVEDLNINEKDRLVESKSSKKDIGLDVVEDLIKDIDEKKVEKKEEKKKPKKKDDVDELNAQVKDLNANFKPKEGCIKKTTPDMKKRVNKSKVKNEKVKTIKKEEESKNESESESKSESDEDSSESIEQD